ncbi:hypothetical protein HUN01_34365 [Nostoc edaphicum CCNP1411]|uniref:Uncharacterized protein n=1 Tax=Nostoc edaphicum CCNP1411 TaxID=1472755 RepID=A0A7D7LHR0_9NOSO|nr:hypothetical protein [Nostoc edaphicum]QMS92428.1 hypothetical protein HUN01_34365 [Nostoc edaphicum CCNP1411]
MKDLVAYIVMLGLFAPEQFLSHLQKSLPSELIAKNMVLGLLGILKFSGAYVPVD